MKNDFSFRKTETKKVETNLPNFLQNLFPPRRPCPNRHVEQDNPSFKKTFQKILTTMPVPIIALDVMQLQTSELSVKASTNGT